MASAYATLAASGVYHKPHFVQKVVNADGEVLFDASQQDNSGEQKIDKAVADNVTSAMQPIAGYQGTQLSGGRPSAAKTGTNQLGDTDANRDAWMVGYTPSLSTAVWVGTTEGTKPLVNSSGAAVYGSGIPSNLEGDDGRCAEGHDNETFPKPTEIGGYAGRARHRRHLRRPTAAVGDGDPADAGGGPGHHDSVRSADHGVAHPPPPPPPPPGDPGAAEQQTPTATAPVPAP